MPRQLSSATVVHRDRDGMQLTVFDADVAWSRSLADSFLWEVQK